MPTLPLIKAIHKILLEVNDEIGHSLLQFYIHVHSGQEYHVVDICPFARYCPFVTGCGMQTC